MLLISHRLRAEPIDKMSVYITMDTPDPVLGPMCPILFVSSSVLG